MNKVLKYQGNTKYFAALIEAEEKFFIMLAFTSSDIDISQQRDYGSYSLEGNRLHFCDNFSLHLNLKLDTCKDVVWQLVTLDNIKEYDIMVKLLEVLYPDDAE